MSVTVVTDSAASLPEADTDRLGLVVVPMKLVLGGVVYGDGELDADEVVARASAASVSTSSPSPGEFAKAVEDHDPEAGALVITVASHMSAAFEAARVASSYFDPGAVQVLDSGTAAGAQGLVVLAAAERAAAGADLDEVTARARAVASNVRLVAALENLDHLARSGRVPGAAAWAGRSLGVRAMFEFADGHVKPRRPAMSVKSVFDRLVEATAEGSTDGGMLRVAVLHSHRPDDAEHLITRIHEAHPLAGAFVAPFSSVMVAHTGPGLIGVAWWWDDPAPQAA